MIGLSLLALLSLLLFGVRVLVEGGFGVLLLGDVVVVAFVFADTGRVLGSIRVLRIDGFPRLVQLADLLVVDKLVEDVGILAPCQAGHQEQRHNTREHSNAVLFKRATYGIICSDAHTSSVLFVLKICYILDSIIAKSL